MLERIVSSTMAFFDTTPVGRIINRFSKDMDEVDLMIPTHIKDILSDLFSVLGTLFVVCYATPIIIAAVIPLVLIFFFIQSAYLATSRQLKRMINVTRSPINSSLTESFSGAPTIRYYFGLFFKGLLWNLHLLSEPTRCRIGSFWRMNRELRPIKFAIILRWLPILGFFAD